jgi:predicted phosphodiesterase
MIKITFISDTHTLHNELELPGGDILIHAGDIMNSGYDQTEIVDFCKWFAVQKYNTLIFIAGNHDRRFENHLEDTNKIIKLFKRIHYLQDEELIVGNDGKIESSVKIYGSPWQPEFYNWAFNLPRGGEELKTIWEAIPEETDILITHGPPQDHLDVSGSPYNEPHLGCEVLRARVDEIKPKIHVFGHIHGGHGYKLTNATHFINASIVNEQYELEYEPITLEWDRETNELKIM